MTIIDDDGMDFLKKIPELQITASILSFQFANIAAEIANCKDIEMMRDLAKVLIDFLDMHPEPPTRPEAKGKWN